VKQIGKITTEQKKVSIFGHFGGSLSPLIRLRTLKKGVQPAGTLPLKSGEKIIKVASNRKQNRSRLWNSV